MKNLLALGLAMVCLAGCAGSKSESAQLSLALTSAERAALAYTSLPRCPVADKTLCSEVVIVTQIKVADYVAYAAVKAAEGNGSVADADKAVTALISLIPIK